MNSAKPAQRSIAAKISAKIPAKIPAPVTALLGGLALAGFGSLAMVSTAQAQSGKASWYASGHRTASGERFNPNGLTAAHRSLPFGTRVRVTNESNGRSVVVRINDRGPFAHGRIIDLARGAGRAIGMNGVARVAVAVVD